MFLSKYLPCSSNKRYGEKEDKILVIMAKLNVRNIRPITKSSYFNCRENNDVAFKFNFAAQLAFFTGCDVTFCWMIQTQKMCQASQSVLPRPWVRLISTQRGGLAALKLTKLFGIDDFPAAKDSGKVLIIIIYCYLIIIIIVITHSFLSLGI